MFERFTEKAIKVILLAQEEARRLGHNFVGVEFIFLGLIGEATGIAAKVLRQQGITLKNARIEVEKILGRGSGMITVEPPFTESAKFVLNGALSFAEQLGSESINTKHLLIGIFQEGESTARILQNLRVNPQDLAVSLSQYFQQQPSDQLPKTVYVLLYNAGTDNEGIHTISSQEKETILMFEASADANNYARRLGEQNFPVPSVERIETEDILLFCKKSGYDCEFVPEGANPTPPSQTQTISQQDYFNFLMETLQKIHENPNPQVIYPFWAKNLDKLDLMNAVLESWEKELIRQVTPEDAEYIATVIFKFSNLIQKFPLGNIAVNKEIAIAGYEIALTIFTFKSFPQEWAATHNNLANAYFYRIRGDKAENLERAITFCTEALKVRTFEAFPQQWAMAQSNLALVYSNRIRGDKAENLERAIAFYTEALKVYTFDAFPQDWARTQNNLIAAYSNRIREDKAENLEMAIAVGTKALKVRTFEAFPKEWANTQNNLALAYLYRIRGDKAENLERAIAFHTEALKVYTFDAFPQDWAMTQNNLAVAYLYRIRGDKAENLEVVIACHQEALKVRTFDDFPQDWAQTQNNLANAYNNRVRGDKAENLEKAIAFYTEALKVYTFDAFPQDWAMTQNNLATAYSDRIRGDKSENLEKAIASYHNALKIRTKEDDPLSCLLTARNLADLHYNQQQWQLATEAYHIAIEAVENARLEALNPQSRQETLSNAIDVFHRIVQAHLKLNQPEKALEYIERSKTRNLVELMTQKNVKPKGVSQEIIDQLDELRQRWVNEQIRLQSRSINQNISSNDKLMPYISDDSHLKEYRQAWEDFIDEKITPIDPNFTQTQIVQPITFKDIQALTDAETCLLQLYITGEKILAFIVSSDGDIKYWESSETELQAFIETIRNYLQLDYSETGKKESINKLPNLLQTFSNVLHINDILGLIPNTCKRLIIIPHRYLHILPLHALPIDPPQPPLKKRESQFDPPQPPLKKGESQLILQDKYDVQYAPSCQLLQIAQGSNNSEFDKLFAIQNPTKDLHFTDLEVNIISTFFAESQIIAKDNATKETVTTNLKASDSHCHHFSCHGGFNPNNPLESALFLANYEPLKLGEIFELNLKKSRLVVLSACETGLIDLNSISDEYIGLPSGFLFAGSPSVVSSLWTVNDLSTAFLMMKFYEILFNTNMNISVAVALKESQNWLQNLTSQQFILETDSIIDKLYSNKPRTAKSYKESARKLVENSEEYPFKNPYYWAAFFAAGR